MILHTVRPFLFTLIVLWSINAFSQKDGLSFLALGDSYTVGTSELPQHSWPEQFVQLIAKKGILLNPPTILAGEGWTTDKLLSEIESATLESEYDLVSLLIGVNNQYRDLDNYQFKDQFNKLLQKSISLAGNDTSRVFVLSIP
ncbi:MAG: GDSL-type esterase/lipase family protein, partial [Maribacter sp.]|uniref:GDSL-type esterase/lipase family protein n=1 Tax=Maribacter sp. TaxID=1897614 RepID=UPI003C74610C